MIIRTILSVHLKWYVLSHFDYLHYHTRQDTYIKKDLSCQKKTHKSSFKTHRDI